jgi:hypothetical protein
MGRPKGAKNKTAAKASEPGATKSVRTVDMARAALAEGIEQPSDGVAYIKAKFGVELPKPMWSSYRAQLKAREQKASGPTPKPAASPEHGGGGETDLITAMETLKPFVAEHGPERLKPIIVLLG